MHLVGFIIRTYHDARSPERQMFRTSYVHHQEDCIVHAVLYGMFFMHLCKQSSRLEDVLERILQPARLNLIKH